MKLQLKRRDKTIEKFKVQYRQRDLKHVTSSIRSYATSAHSKKRISIISKDFCEKVDDQLGFKEKEEDDYVNAVFGDKTRSKDKMKKFGNIGLHDEATYYLNKLDSRIDSLVDENHKLTTQRIEQKHEKNRENNKLREEILDLQLKYEDAQKEIEDLRKVRKKSWFGTK